MHRERLFESFKCNRFCIYRNWFCVFHAYDMIFVQFIAPSYFFLFSFSLPIYEDSRLVCIQIHITEKKTNESAIPIWQLLFTSKKKGKINRKREKKKEQKIFKVAIKKKWVQKCFWLEMNAKLYDYQEKIGSKKRHLKVNNINMFLRVCFFCVHKFGNGNIANYLAS